MAAGRRHLMVHFTDLLTEEGVPSSRCRGSSARIRGAHVARPGRGRVRSGVCLFPATIQSGGGNKRDAELEQALVDLGTSLLVDCTPHFAQMVLQRIAWEQQP